MSLFQYLNYDGKYTDKILQTIKNKTGSKILETKLNKMLETGSGVTYYDENIKEVSDSNGAKYMLLDTGLKSKTMGDSENVFVQIVKIKNIWTGGYVETFDKLMAHMQTTEQQITNNYNFQAEVADKLKDGYDNGVTEEEITKIYNDTKEKYAVDIDSSAPKLIRNICEIMLDFGDEWDNESVKKVIASVIRIANCEIERHAESGEDRIDNWILFNVDHSKVIINTGFIGDDNNYIYIMAGIKNGKIASPAVLNSYAAALANNFSGELPNGSICGMRDMKVPFLDTGIDLTDRSRFLHCINERSFRGGDAFADMTSREIRDRIKLSIEMDIELQKRGIDMIATSYYIKGSDITWCIPVYAKPDMDISKPDMILFVSLFNDGLYKIATSIDVLSAYNNIITADRYPRTVWLKKFTVKDLNNQQINDVDIDENAEE